MQAGWYRDPTGRREHRYWDGSRWTENVSVGGQSSTDAIEGDYAPPDAPPAPVVAQRARKWPRALVITIVLVLGGCTALVIASVNKAVEELNAEQKRHAITDAQFSAVQIGTPKLELIATLGKQPENTQEFVSEGIVSEEEIRSSCIYYNRAGGEFGDLFQFCFDGDDLLDAKNSY